ncbi:copper chaperone PCu(A)C [Streptomyces sp. O3]
MSRSLRRGAIAATALAFSLAALTACGAGNDAQTLGVRPDNAATSVGDIKIQNSVLITQPEPGGKGPAAVSATLFNEGDKDQTLDAVKVEGIDGDAELKPAEGSGSIIVPAHGSVVVGGEGNASAVLADGNGTAAEGNAQPITFSFSETGDITLRSAVVPATGYYAEWGPEIVSPKSPEPDASATAEPADGDEAAHGAEAGDDAHGEGDAHGADTEGADSETTH